MSLVTPINVEKLQKALQAKAKEEPEYRFYQLYDKIYRKDILDFAYRLCRSHKGTPGIDGCTFDQIESSGAEAWLGELAETLRQKTYKADPVRRVWIPKPNGKQRPLGITTPPSLLQLFTFTREQQLPVNICDCLDFSNSSSWARPAFPPNCRNQTDFV